MTPSKSEPIPHILFLFSDTGGGHRSAAKAIIEALELDFPGQASWEMVDFFKNYTPPPFDIATDTYAPFAQFPDVWEFGYKASDGKQSSKFLQRAFSAYVRRDFKRLMAEHPCDLYLSVHPVINTPLLRVLPKNRPPYMTVVTDMVSTHHWWYEKKTDLLIVATEEAKQRGIKIGFDPAKIRVVGLPIADSFRHPQPKSAARKKLGLPADLPLVLMVSGGEGMGPLEETIEAIIAAKVPVGMVVVTGKNQALKARLEALPFPYPAFIRGFVNNMPEYMQACDAIITKAGPGTISEAFTAALPIIIYSRMPGQEDGNVEYVVNHQAGIWEPDPVQLAGVLQHWLENPAELQAYSKNSLAQARPDSSHIIAQFAMALLGKYPIDQIKTYDLN